jgi:glycosyltransferase involved in cell wall biosynthesis
VAFEWDIDLLSGYDSEFLQNEARRPSTERFNGCNTPAIWRKIAEGGFNAFIVPGWALRSYWQAVEACRKARVPVLVRGDSQLHFHRSLAVRLAKRVAYGTMLRRFDGFLYVGQRNREYLAHYGVKSDRMFFSPHCVDNDAFRTASDVARAKTAAPGGVGAARRILFVGKLMERKRPHDVIRAAAALSKRTGGLEVVVAGAGQLENELKKAAEREGVRASFLGFVNQSRMPAIYASADVLVLPSSQETWGLVVNEAMACGVPAVVSKVVGCAPDLVEDGSTGAIFDEGNIEGCAAAIDKVLSLNVGDLRRRLAERMVIYSPAGAAEGIVRAARALAAGSQGE